MQNSQNPPVPILPYNSHSILKIKPIFLNKTKWARLLPADIVTIKKRKLKMLRTIEITDLHDYRVPAQDVRSLRGALVDAKTISSLIIGKDHRTDLPLPPNCLKALLSSSSRFYDLFFRFQDKGKDKVLNKNTMNTLTRLRRCKDLSSLEIHFSCHEETRDEMINRLSQQIRGLSKLKALHLDSQNCQSYTARRSHQNYDPNHILLKFRYPRCLSSLTVHFDYAISVNQKLFPTFISNIQRCRRLKSLNFNSQRTLANQATSVSMIWDPIFKNPNLQYLTLFLHFSDDNIHEFLEDFSHLKNLVALNLNISSYLSIKEFNFFTATLYDHLASFPNFKALKMRISHFNKAYPEFHLIFLPPHKNLPQLEHLDISFPPVADLSKSNLQSLSQSLQYLYNLKTLYLSFPTDRVSVDGIIFLVTGFKNIYYLHDLSLKFPYANLSNKSIKAIFDCIAHLPLNNLNLHLGELKTRNMLTNLWKEKLKLTPFFSALYGFNLLTSLDLNLFAFKLSTAEAKHFSLALKELKGLIIFSITLPEFDFDHKYEGLRSFFASFKALTKLSSLRMTFIDENLGDEEVRSLVENLQGCRSLKVLNVHFDQEDQRSEDSICYLSGLKDLVLLQRLWLDFTKAETFRNEPIFELLESLTALKYLESLRLHYHSSKHSPKVLRFAKNLVNHQRFRSLTNFVVNERIF